MKSPHSFCLSHKICFCNVKRVGGCVSVMDSIVNNDKKNGCMLNITCEIKLIGQIYIVIYIWTVMHKYVWCNLMLAGWVSIMWFRHYNTNIYCMFINICEVSWHKLVSRRPFYNCNNCWLKAFNKYCMNQVSWPVCVCMM